MIRQERRGTVLCHLSFGLAVLLAGLAPVAGQPIDSWQPTDGWYMLHHDPQRTGRSAHGPEAPFQRVWHRKFWEEIISAEVEPILAEGRLMFGTWGGTFYALDPYTGKDIWTAEAPGGVRHAAAYTDGKVYYATLGGRTGGAVVCRRAGDGKDWYSMPVNQYNNRHSYFNCPDELLVALAQAAPLLDAEGRAAATQAADRAFDKHFPLDVPWRPIEEPMRGWADLKPSQYKPYKTGPWMSPMEKNVARFKTLYGLWAYADAFDRWDRLRDAWPEIKAAKDRIAEWSFTPNWSKRTGPDGPGTLTAEVADADRYRHELLRYMTVGTHGFYHNNWPRDEANITMYAQFGYTKLLSALIGYGRIADELGHPAEARWARERFEHVARQALTYRTAPYYWSSPWLVPEVARMLRDHAGEFLVKVEKTSPVLVGSKEDGFENEGPHYRVFDTNHWWVNHLGSNGAVPPCSVMSGFLVRALLWEVDAKALDEATDIPWCQADYWYIQKCATAIAAYEKPGWTKN